MRKIRLYNESIERKIARNGSLFERKLSRRIWRTGKWIDETSTTPKIKVNARSFVKAIYDWKIEISHRQKELSECKLKNVLEENYDSRIQSMYKIACFPWFCEGKSITIDLLLLLGHFADNYENWKRQLELLKTMYHLSGKYVRILFGMRLIVKEKSSKWLQSKPDYIIFWFKTFCSSYKLCNEKVILTDQIFI